MIDLRRVKLNNEINIVHYWGGVPLVPTSKWLRTLQLIDKCQTNGCNNWLVLSKKPDDLSLINPIIETGCKIIYLPRSKRNFDFGSIYRTFKFLREIKCHIFHCHNDHTSPIIGALLSSVPVKIWSKLSMSSAYETNNKLSGFGRLMASTRITCWCADQILAISDAVKKEVYEQVGFKKKIDVVHAPVPIDKYIQATGKGIREEFRIKQSEFLIVAVGHFAEVKGWDIAVDSFALVHKSYPNSKLFLIGKKTSESFYQKIMAKIRDYGLSESVVLAGNRSDIPEVLKACDLFILPSRSEGTPASLIEAMAAGLPSIATSTGGIPEVIEHNVNGLLFQRDNSADLAEKIISLISNKVLRAKFSEMGQKNLHKYSLDVYVETVFSQYLQLLREKNSVEHQV